MEMMQKMGFSKSAVTFCLFILVLFFFSKRQLYLENKEEKRMDV